VRKPYVNLLVTQYLARQVAVMGEVNKPGKYPINQPVNVTDVLAMAGGVTSKLQYDHGSQEGPAGNTARREIDVKRLLAHADMSKDFQVDSATLFSCRRAGVLHYGEVRQPGAYPIATDMTIRQALSVGGGLTLRGTERGIQLGSQDCGRQMERYRRSSTTSCRRMTW